MCVYLCVCVCVCLCACVCVSVCVCVVSVCVCISRIASFRCRGRGDECSPGTALPPPAPSARVHRPNLQAHIGMGWDEGKKQASGQRSIQVDNNIFTRDTHTLAHTLTHTHTHFLTHTRTHTHTHTHTHTPLLPPHQPLQHSHSYRAVA